MPSIARNTSGSCGTTGAGEVASITSRWARAGAAARNRADAPGASAYGIPRNSATDPSGVSISRPATGPRGVVTIMLAGYRAAASHGRVGCNRLEDL